MNWLSDNFQIVILVALALASWLKTRMDAKAAEREEQQAREEMGEGELYGPPEEWEQEAQSASSLPPPVLHTARSMAAAEAARESEAMLKHQMNLQERVRQMRANRAVTTGGASAARSRVAAKAGPRPGDAKVVSYKHLIGNRKSLRNAIVTREILGKPLGLR